MPFNPCEICDTQDLCASGRTPCTLSGEFCAPVPTEVANELLSRTRTRPRTSLTLRVRSLIGEEGPQLPDDQYEQRIDRELEQLTNAQLLEYISRAMESVA